ncbi:4-(cytidine 5'-diphospho)-2-C-methyl-D-erythritol kinase [Prevotella intermedia]|uniref:4-diphosphocytidyl-2-C-methyl-D-erythritol kinase n=1 Tax=Prevotella intermedia ZT TaxID=1347790 RepID=A0AAP0V770_PREIN|nr:4-(cytidine 5'-diphospho)-2-C-methyl-D-erythritol kinase [Prevotella intermedia]ATV34070.1 4-(cytidine 5'-diphospho)-2-C-methyl-D-erythritol kinase [Prevotella intermedia]ATV41531.1 4-(cytidine 5'-diphospho)-2-C-methyl-D-erythritol kinase [Prevotella intermedia]KJJ87777.1 4-diphosphocytidyl-2C-methyl-D-erythritol kinase [Prevotella intermedia ZT]
MIVYPNCKINLGLNVVRKRTDGYHDLETVFYPVPLTDKLEAVVGNGADGTCSLSLSGNPIEGNAADNLIVKAYNLLAADHRLPHIDFDLEKHIPSQAGLGGGSSDATYTLRLLNELCQLHLDSPTLQRYAARLGADCAFFVTAEPSFATGIGDILTPMADECAHLKGLYLLIVKPSVAISTAQAFSFIKPQPPIIRCKEVVAQPIDEWRDRLGNDFEVSIFNIHPEIRSVKQQLYTMGATYAQMSGSGSAFFGIFNEAPTRLPAAFDGMFTYLCQL